MNKGGTKPKIIILEREIIRIEEPNFIPPCKLFCGPIIASKKP
ncbi:MAG: hypothetical protein QW551_05425 [Desulfurococcaceae archaeon]